MTQMANSSFVIQIFQSRKTMPKVPLGKLDTTNMDASFKIMKTKMLELLALSEPAAYIDVYHCNTALTSRSMRH